MLYRQKSKYQSCSFIIFFLISAIILVFCSQTYASELEGEEQPAEQAYELIESGTLEETLAGEDEETSGDTGTAKHFPEVYTLMLLDRTRVDYEEVVNKEDGLFWPFISPRVITMKNRKDYFSTAVKHRYSVCKLMRQRNENRAEALINTMMEVPVKRAEAGGAPALATSAPEQVFSAAMILIPLTDSPDRILAYLFGNWLSILNVDTIVKNFGLRAATSVGIFCDEQDRANDKLAIINQVESEDCRIDDPMNLRVRSRRGLHIFNHFRLNVGDSKVEVVRFKPVFTWGRAYITASDAFQFRPQELEETRLQRLHNTAEEIYKIFKNATSKQIYIPFQPFIDIPVSKELAEILTVELVNNWPKYFRSPKCLKKSWRDLGFAADETVDIVYPHWTYWFRTRDARNKREIFAFRGRRIEQDAIVELKLYNGNLIKILLLRLIRTLPIKFRDKYYWFDRGDWFEISETRIQAMAAELERDKFDYRDPLLLPPYDEERIRLEKTEGAARGPEEVSIKEAEGEDEAEIEAEGDAETNVTPEVKGDYEELAYNKEAFQRLTACVEEGNVSWVALMDRANVLLTGHHDKFEFADLVLKVQDHYYLIHVKRAKANSLGHVCTQAERCGMFLSGHLDRSNLDLTFMMAELNSHPKTFAGTRETSSDLFNKSILPDRLDGEYHAFLEAHVFNKNNVFCDALKAFIKTTDFDAKFWFAHHSLFCHVLSRMATLIDEKLTTETFKEFHTIAKNGINKSVFFTEAGVLGAEKRRKITIVVAIIDDGKTPFALIPKEREFKTNSIVRLHQTRQTLSEKRLGFAWTVIPKKADVPIETLREYAYSADDIDTILKLKVLKNPSPTASPSAKKPPRKDASIEINMGTRKEPQTITLIQVPAKNMLIVPSFKKSKSAGTTETYLAKVFNKLVQQKRIMIPYTILMPCEIKGHWVTVEICLKEKSIQIKVIKCRANDKDGLDKKAETFKDNLIERADFESAAMALYNKGAKAKSKPKPKGSKTKDKSKSSPSLETKIDFQIEGPFMHPYTHASGAITVRNILRMITDRAPPDAEEEIGDADATIYQIKREHLQFLVARKQNFSIVFEVDGEADITPRAETRRAPVRQLRQATLEAHIASGTVTTHTRSRDASKGTPAGTPPSNEKGEVQLGELEVSPERRLESGAAKEENDDRISDRIKGEILTKYSELIRVDHSFVTINGKKYIKGIIDGTKGNCCFIALGLTRDVFIEKTCEYITHIEKSLQGCLKDIPIECHQRIIEFLEGAIANVNEKNIQKLKDLDWGAKINTIKSFSEDEKRVLLSGLENLRDKVLALNDGASLDEVRTLLKQLLDLYKDSELLKEKYDVYRYETFKHNFTSFLEGRIEEGEDFHLLKTIFSGGNSATKKSIIQYVFGSDTEKAEKNEWLDPSFIKHLYDVYNIKFVIYENNDGTYQIKCNSDHRSDDDSEIRYLFYSGASHYDLLIPLPEE